MFGLGAVDQEAGVGDGAGDEGFDDAEVSLFAVAEVICVDYEGHLGV